ncbi:hypothetical protein BCV73_09030 [Paenibacillus sp. SSG-1]|nr:hypothetical protein BCV73_09030 [Paenibacillus sp. SSG-1]
MSVRSLYRRYAAAALVLVLSFCWMFPAGAEAKIASQDLIIVNKKTNKLAYFSSGKLVKEFRVATGKSPELTPEGTFEIVNKIKNRPYYKEKIPGGDPRNPLGDRWIGLNVNGTMGTTYAIHGNSNKNSIGKYVSAGCIRMYNDEIHWLFEQVPLHTLAIITTSSQSFETIAQNHGYAVGVQSFDGKLVVNGKEAQLKQDLIMVDSRIYIPLRACFELLGGTVEWNASTQTVTVYTGNRKITHKALSGKAVVNGKTVNITASRLQGNSLMLPLRNMSEISGYSVVWDGASNTVNLTTGK